MFRLWLAHRALQRPTVKGYATMSAAALTQINAVEIKGPERSGGVSGRAVAPAPIKSEALLIQIKEQKVHLP
jgi:hypothetical protein